MTQPEASPPDPEDVTHPSAAGGEESTAKTPDTEAEAEPEAEPPRWWQFADQTRPPEPEPAPVPELADPVPPVVVGPPLSRRVSERREYDPLRGWEPGRRPINGG